MEVGRGCLQGGGGGLDRLEKGGLRRVRGARKRRWWAAGAVISLYGWMEGSGARCSIGGVRR